MSHRSDSTSENLVNDLVAEWVERRQCGDEVPLGVLCSHDPRLIATVSAQIERLKQTDWLFDETERTLGGGAGDIVGDDLLGRDRWSRRVLGEYQILERIGEGGMGQVYKALHRSMRRIVALKVIHPRILRSPDAVARFRREMAAAARLNHPHIVVSHDAGESQGWNFLVMEYVDGIDLASLVQRDGPLAVDRAVSYVLQAARALAYTHREGIVHRDVKPSNLMLDDSGTLKLLDLGLARIADEAAQEQPDSAHTLTGSGRVMGTVDYLAPEQACDSRRADECSDIYALGCTLYALVHGRPMYDGRSMVGRLLAHQDTPAPALGADRSDVSPRLEAIFQRMVAKRPRDRFQDMEELASALSGADSRPVRPQFGPWRFLHRRWAWAALALVVAAFAGGALSTDWGMFFGRDEEHRQSPLAIQGRRHQPPEPVPPPAALAPFDQQQARVHQQRWAAYLGVPIDYENTIGMRFRLILLGEFTMGTCSERAEVLAKESPHYANAHRLEAPPRSVQITRPYYLATCEVTQQQYQAVTGKSPSYFSPHGAGWEHVEGLDTRSHPIEMVSWLDAVAFCNALSQREGRTHYYLTIDGGPGVTDRDATGYRLPSEAEWEFACRAGWEGPFGFVGPECLLEQYAIYHDNSGGRTHPVASREPNAFGLYDMHGNVWERCSDYYTVYDPYSTVDPRGPGAGVIRSLRGGSWDNPPSRCRSAMRTGHASNYTSKFTGFRVVLSVPATCAQ